jgi:DNA-binding NarL/FixJ family response regulator
MFRLTVLRGMAAALVGVARIGAADRKSAIGAVSFDSAGAAAGTTDPQHALLAASDGGAKVYQHLLTAREREILGLMATGMTNPQIAAQLVIGAGTVKTHTLNIYRKLEVGNRTQAIVRAQALGIWYA